MCVRVRVRVCVWVCVGGLKKMIYIDVEKLLAPLLNNEQSLRDNDMTINLIVFILGSCPHHYMEPLSCENSNFV